MKKVFRYKGVKVNSFGIPVWNLNKTDRKLTNKKYFQYQCFDPYFEESTPKNLIVMYDIPYEKRKERDWFRRHLKKYNYILIQKSVWVGPSPLPKVFVDYVKAIGLLKQLRVFKLAKPYTGKENVYKGVL